MHSLHRRQLLLFSRRQVQQPRNLDLNQVVSSLGKMLRGIIGEDVCLVFKLHAAQVMPRAAFVIDKAGVVQNSEQTPSPKDLPDSDQVKATLARL